MSDAKKTELLFFIEEMMGLNMSTEIEDNVYEKLNKGLSIPLSDLESVLKHRYKYYKNKF